MFVEGEVEIKIKDRSTAILDEHELKLWVQRGFKDISCYRISNFRKESEKVVRVVIALKTADLADSERELIESHPNDVGLLRGFLEKMFVGKGTCRAIGDPKLRAN